MMRSSDLGYWVESPHLFYDPDVLKLIPKDLEKAEKQLKDAPGKKDALEQVNTAYMSMYNSVQALMHSIQYKTTHMRCIVTVLEDYFIKHGILERDLLNRFLRSQKIEGTPEENFQSAEAWFNAVKGIVNK
ncbi:hypothetical protein L0222_17850 [bacterium]|nr:hypothetical protein [bacterium]MCI0603428.1 hypothetical protein [bacterium]